MRIDPGGLTVLACIGGLACCGATSTVSEDRRPPARKTATPADADTLAIRNLVDQLSSAVDDGDVSRLVPLFTEDAVLMPYNEVELTGREAIRVWMERLFGEYNYARSLYHFEDFQVANSWAFARGTYTQNLAPKAGGNSIHLAGSCVLTFQRGDRNDWLVTSAVWTNSSHPGAIAPAAVHH
jgi:uncharacterized protein (TIGR02246 family)